MALQIAYLPTLYSACIHRETKVALLNARPGCPRWGQNRLARTHYRLGSGEPNAGAVPLTGAARVLARRPLNSETSRHVPSSPKEL